MKKLILILAVLCVGCNGQPEPESQPNKYKMILTTEMLDSYVHKKHVPILDSTLNEMGVYGGSYLECNPRYLYEGYVDGVLCRIFFNTDKRGLIESYYTVKK